MSALPNKIDDRPMFIAPLQMGKLQIGQFPPPQPAAKQDGENRSISSAPDCVRRGSLPESAGLFSRQPVAQSDAQFSDAFHAPNAGRQLRAQQACIGGFVSEPSHGRQPPVDRTCAASWRFSRKMRYRVTTALLNDKRGSEQYH